MALYVLVLLAVITANCTYQILVYQALVPKLVWSVDTLHLNVIANRDAWRACKNFNWCEERHSAQWPIVWRGEVRWLA